jgi:hypothetical protein
MNPFPEAAVSDLNKRLVELRLTNQTDELSGTGESNALRMA